ncbi:MAG: FAD-linked oxidase C-terminal domain-containing protein [Ilumatobacteraceae bacterium]
MSGQHRERRELIVRQLTATGLPPAAIVAAEGHDRYRHDSSLVSSPTGDPAVVTRPATTAEVVTIVRTAFQLGVPIVPRGGGTGLAGGASAIDGCVVVSTERMTATPTIHEDDLIAVVQPGVLNARVAAAAIDRGLWYAPDPASRDICTIGGNVATNAGGLCCVRSGSTRDHVLGLEVVLADGRVTWLGTRTVKGVAGYDLRSLFVGSEGTLGLITEATLRLTAPPPPMATVVATFHQLERAGRAAAFLASRARPSLLELMDRTTLEAVEAMTHMGLTADALLLLQVDAAVPSEMDELVAAVRDTGADEVHVTADVEEAQALMEVRRLAYPALDRLGKAFLDDIAVPLSQIAPVIAGIERIAEQHGIIVGTFGHAGDGNLHPTLVVDPGNESDMRRAWCAFEAILRLALQHGGTITGEHGVGRLKASFLALELDHTVTELHRAIKRSLDPMNIFNPGKLLPVPDGHLAGGGDISCCD